MEYTVPILKQLLKEYGVRVYSGKSKAELIAMLQDSNPLLYPTKRASPPLPRSKKLP